MYYEGAISKIRQETFFLRLKLCLWLVIDHGRSCFICRLGQGYMVSLCMQPSKLLCETIVRIFGQKNRRILEVGSPKKEVLSTTRFKEFFCISFTK